MTTTLNYLYDLDRTGVNSQNRIHDEKHTLQSYVPGEWRFVVPRNAPFFTANYEVYLIDQATNNKIKLERYQHYSESHPYSELTNVLKKQICGSIMILDSTIVGTITIEYNTIGGPFTIDSAKILEIMANKLVNPVNVDWSQVVDVPAKFPPEIHYHPAENLGEYSQLIKAVKDCTEAMKNEYDVNSVTLNRHLQDDNPHGITLEKLNIPHLRNTHIATDKEIEDGSNIVALVTAAGLGYFANIYNLKKGSGGTANEKDLIDAIQDDLNTFKDSLNKVKNYGVADNDTQLVPDAKNLYATVANAFSIIKKQYASIDEAFNYNMWDKIITPATLHGVLNEYMQIGSMFFLPRALVKSSRCVIPNGARFNTTVYPDLYQYLGSDYLPPAHGVFIKSYSPGIDPEDKVGQLKEGNKVLSDVDGNVTIDINQGNLLIPHFHQIDFKEGDQPYNTHYYELIGKTSDRNNTIPDGNYGRITTGDMIFHSENKANRPYSNSLGNGETNYYASKNTSVFKITTLPFLNDGNATPTAVTGNSNQQINANANLNLNKSWVVPEPKHILLNLVMRAK